VKTSLRRLSLAGLILGLVLGAGLRIYERPVLAQAGVSTATTSSTTAADDGQQEADENAEYTHSPQVRQFGKMIGMDGDLSAKVFEILNFVVLVALAGWAVARFMPKILRDRSTAIEKGLAEARTATEEARSRLSGVEERLSKLDGEIANLRAHAEQEAQKEEQRFRTAVDEEKKKIVALAEQEIAAATMHAQKQLQQHAAELAIEQAARKLVVSAETDRLLVQGFAQRLAGDESKKGQN